MQQLDVPDEMKVSVDYGDMQIPVSAKKIKPLVYKDGDSICVVLGPDPQEGIFGCGSNTNAALKDWDTHLKDYLKSYKEDDEITRYIIEKIPGGLDEIR